MVVFKNKLKKRWTINSSSPILQLVYITAVPFSNGKSQLLFLLDFAFLNNDLLVRFKKKIAVVALTLASCPLSATD